MVKKTCISRNECGTSKNNKECVVVRSDGDPIGFIGI